MANEPIRRIIIDLFAEDRAHEAFKIALLLRIAEEEGRQIIPQPRSARGGHGRALAEFDLYQMVVLSQTNRPHVIVVCIDGNCKGMVEARNEISGHIKRGIGNCVIVACPNPHIERWYLADPDSFHSVVGSRPTLGRRKCERGFYKRKLVQAIKDAGHPATLSGVEFAQEIVGQMDLYRAGRNETSLKNFVDQLRDFIRAL
jgi:hypothetical protein